MKTTTAERDPGALAKLKALIDDIAVAMVVTVSVEGSLRSRPMLTQQVRDEGELWFFTSEDSETAHDLAEERAVNVAYSDPERNRFVSITGQATLLHDETKLGELWDPALTRYFPQGLDDPHLTLMRVRIEFADYWDVPSSRMVSLRLADKGAAATPRNIARSVESEHTKVEIRATPTSG
jgi:general stress protein 26